MPDKTSVRAVLRIRRDGSSEELSAEGVLHRLVSAWALTCRIRQAPDESGVEAVSDMTLIVRPREIRMTRKGAVEQEQIFRMGEWQEGRVGTLYGTMPAEAWTHSIEVGLTDTGGSVRWDYEMRMAGHDLGRSSILLDIREAQEK